MKLRHKTITSVAQEIGRRPDILEILDSNAPLESIFSIVTKLPLSRVEQYKKVYFGVGNTDCYKLNLPNDNKLYVKMECSNSMGNTHYSRFWIIYLFISEVLIIVPSCLPETRIAPMRRKTTNIVQVDGYIDSCIIKLREMINSGNYYATNHSEERADIITHVFSRIGHEFVRDHGTPDYSVLAFGNGSSTEAIARVFKKANNKAHIYAYRPDFEKHPGDIVFGLLAANISLKHVPVAEKLIDMLLHTNSLDLTNILSKYRHDTVISNLGPSSLFGINYAYEISKKEYGKSIFTIGYDKNDRY